MRTTGFDGAKRRWDTIGGLEEILRSKTNPSFSAIWQSQINTSAIAERDENEVRRSEAEMGRRRWYRRDFAQQNQSLLLRHLRQSKHLLAQRISDEIHRVRRSADARPQATSPSLVPSMAAVFAASNRLHLTHNPIKTANKINRRRDTYITTDMPTFQPLTSLNPHSPSNSPSTSTSPF